MKITGLPVKSCSILSAWWKDSMGPVYLLLAATSPSSASVVIKVPHEAFGFGIAFLRSDAFGPLTVGIGAFETKSLSCCGSGG
jgi:hypothetical protein